MPALKQQPERKTAPAERAPKSRSPLNVVTACKDVMARFPKVLARLAE